MAGTGVAAAGAEALTLCYWKLFVWGINRVRDDENSGGLEAEAVGS